MQKAHVTLPLTLTQQDIYFDQLHHGDSPVYNVGGYIKFGQIDVELVNRAHQQTVLCHDAFGLRIVADNQQLGQYVSDQRSTELPLVDLSTQQNPEASAQKWLSELFQTSLEVEQQELFRAYLIKLSEQQYYYVGFAHHLILDGWGFANWAEQLGQFYHQVDEPSGREPWLVMADKDQQYLQSQKYQKDKTYWQSILAQPPKPMLLDNHGYQYRQSATKPSERIVLPVAAQKHGAMVERAQLLDVPVSQLYMAAIAIYFNRAYDADDILFGSPAHNRSGHAQKQMIGVFTSVSPVRLQFGSEQTLTQLCSQIKAVMRKNFKHQRFPIGQMQRDILCRDTQQRVFDIGFNYLKLDSELAINGQTAPLVYLSHNREQTPAMFTVWEYGKKDDVEIQLDHNLAYFCPQEAQLLLKRIDLVLDQVLECEPDSMHSFDILPGNEKHQLLTLGTTTSNGAHYRPVQQLFEDWADKTPDSVAVIWDDQQITYQSLNVKANKLAHFLLQRGCHKQTRIGLCIDRSCDCIVTLLAILKIGGVYVPLDAKYPRSRLSAIVSDSEVSCIVTQNKQAKATEFDGVQQIFLDCQETQINIVAMPEYGVEQGHSSPDDAAYIVYTSGTTGTPKGILAPHRGVTRLVSNPNYVPMGQSSRVLQSSTLSFDAATFEIWAPLANGGTLVLYTESHMDLVTLNKVINRHQVNCAFLTSALFSQWSHVAEQCPTMRHMLCGGDAADNEAVARALEANKDLTFVHAYGPSETTTYATCYPVKSLSKSDRFGRLPIGRAINDTSVYILTPSLELVPTGGIGELFIGGAGVSPGYLNRADLTAEKFIDNPFERGQKLYRSGDLVRLNVAGDIEFVGRLDNQVKISGYRIELGDIESQLNDCDEVASCLVMVDKSQAHNKRLVAYAVSNTDIQSEQDKIVASIRAQLSTKLQPFMMPSLIMLLPKWPTNVNGKIDRKALPKPDFSVVQANYQAPENEPQTKLQQIWAKLLGIECDTLSVNSNFFTLGGNSLLAMRMAGAIKELFAVEIAIKEVFANPTIVQLAKLLERSRPVADKQRIIAGADAIAQPVIASFAQRRMWFVDELKGASSEYNMPGVLDITGEFDIKAAEQAISQIIERHQTLRTVFSAKDGVVYQQVKATFEFTIKTYDLSALPFSLQQHEAARQIETDRIKPFDLGSDLMLRSSYLKLADKQGKSTGVLLFNMHHIASDGWSMTVLLKEFITLYQSNMTANDVSPLSPMAFQYADYSLWEQANLQGEHLSHELDYWLNQLKDLPQVHQLPLDKARPEQMGNVGQTFHSRVSGKLLERLNEFCLSHGATLFMGLHSVFSALLARESRCDDIVVGTVVANREHSEVEAMIGFFVNNLVLRSDLSGAPDFTELLERNKQMVLRAYEHQQVPFELLVEQLQPVRSMSYSPLFQVMIALQNNEKVALSLPELDVELRESTNTSAKYDLMLDIDQQDDHLDLAWRFNVALFDEQRIVELAHQFEQLLDELLHRPQQSVCPFTANDSLGYFSALLKDVDEPTLPFGIDGFKAKQTHRAELTLSATLQQSIVACANQLQLDPSALFHAAWALLISHSSGRDDIVYGTRSWPLRVNLNELSVVELVNQTQIGLQALASYLESSGIEAKSDVVQSAISMPVHASITYLDDGLDAGQHNQPFALTVKPTESGFLLTIDSPDSVDAKALLDYIEQGLIGLCQALNQTPKMTAMNLNILPSQERTRQLELWNQASHNDIGYRSVVELFENQVLQSSDEIALSYQQQSLTFEQLNQQANQLAHYLLEQGLNSEQLVGICVGRSVEMVIAILAVLKAGGAYVPMDPEYPNARLDYIVKDTGIEYLLTQQAVFERISLAKAPQVLLLDEQSTVLQLAQYAPTNPQQTSVTGTTLAYVLYTSGSTGTPKGVMVEHQNLLNLAQNMQRWPLGDADKRWALNASFAFDASLQAVLQMFNGRGVAIIPQALRQQPIDLPAWFIENQITVLDCTPSMAQMWLSLGLGADLPNLVIGGEAITDALWQQLVDWQQQHNRIAFNVYGPTEACVNSTWCRIEGELPNIGRPLVDTKAYVLGNHGQLLPTGAIGQLNVAGQGVARGYLNQRQLTEQQFINDPFDSADGSRMYQTGDLARYLDDGRLQYIGRQDEQVKIRGFRIEPSEITAQLLGHDALDNAVVTAVEMRNMDKSLVAYVVPKDVSCLIEPADKALIARLKSDLGAQLPAHFIPEHVVLLADIPLNASGKVDKKALPPLSLMTLDSKSPLPMTETQLQLAQIWAGLLAIEATEVHGQHNFFEIGGHSLLAVRLVAEIRAELHVELTVKNIFSYPVLAQLDEFIHTQKPQTDADYQRHEITLAPEGPSVASYAQHRLWYIDQLQGASPEYNMAVALKIQGRFDVDAAESAIKRIIQRHQSLRTVFVAKDEQVLQQVLNQYQFKLQRFDLTDLESSQRQSKLNTLILEDSIKPFDLSSDLMVRASYIEVQSNASGLTAVLLFNVHHIASDGWSVGVLNNEFCRHYQALIDGRLAAFEPLALQYRDFAYWQRQYLTPEREAEQLDYWAKQLDCVPQVHNLVLDYPRDQNNNHYGERINHQLNQSTTARLRKLAQHLKVTPFMLFHGALALVLSRHSNRNDIVLGTAVANRTHAQLEPLIGFFVNSLVLRVDTEHSSFGQYLEHVRQVNLDAQANQDVPFERVVDHCNQGRNTSYSPLFQIMFTMNTNERSSLEIEGATISTIEQKQLMSQFEMDISAEFNEQGLLLDWVFDTTLFKSERAQQMAAQFKTLLENLADLPCTDVGGLALSQLQMFDVQQIQHLMFDLGNPIERSLGNETVNALFERQALLTPDKIALVATDENGQKVQLSFTQLNEQANRLAHFLAQQHSGCDSLIGISMKRSPQMIVALLAVLKAGAAYVPLDPDYPLDRIKYMIEDSKIELLLSHAQCRRLCDELGFANTVLLDSQEVIQTVAEQPSTPVVLTFPHSNEDLAYVIYTSGTTGKPKGVMVEHRQWLSYFEAASELYHCTGEDKVLQMCSISFDIFIEEITLSLLCGVTLVVSEYDKAPMASDFWQQLKSQGVTIATLPTAYWHMLAAEPDWAASVQSSTLRLIITGGEALSPASVKQWRQIEQNNCRLFNTYGPTEATVIATAFDVATAQPMDTTVPIGKPLKNTSILVLDSHGNLMPKGCVGQLYLGGSGIVRGYLNREDANKQSFVENPIGSLSPGRWYCTGDLVRYLDDGRLVFVGRADSQVKVRGYRVELGEVQSQLAALEMISDALVTTEVDPLGQQNLVAFIELSHQAGHEKAQLLDILRQALLKTLPNYMVPSKFSVVPHWPVTGNGKVDIKALADIAQPLSQAKSIAPNTPTERALAQLWSELLAVDIAQVCANANFFELGGHSLLITRLLPRVQQRFDVKLEYQSFYEDSSITTIGAQIDAQKLAQKVIAPTDAPAKPMKKKMTL